MRPTSPFQSWRLHLKAGCIWVGRPEHLDVVGNWQKEVDRDKEAFNGSNMVLLGFHEWVYKETSYAPRLTLTKKVPIRKESHKIRALTRIFPTRKDPLCQEMNVNSTLI